MRRVLTATALALAALAPATTLANARGQHAHRADIAGTLAAKQAALAGCLSEHGVKEQASSISKSSLNALMSANPDVRAVLQACGHLPGT
jgi:hypothetical protein